MAEQEQLERLKAGVGGWNRWRMENRGVRVNLWDANLQSADLQQADLRGANLTAAKLQQADLRRADLTRVHLYGAKLNAAKLQHANLGEADLGEADLTGADLRGADLHEADLREADLSHTDLSGAGLSGANLREADLSRADLIEADLRGAKLARVDLTAAKLNGAKLHRAVCLEVKFADVALEVVEGLDEFVPLGPSTVDHRTLAKSRGQIPEVFLRGCGFRDWEIEAAKLHDPKLSRDQITDIGYRVIDLKSRAPIQINPVFISYSRNDSAFVEAVEPLLDEQGIRYWRDVHEMTAGPLDEQIERAIRLNPTYLLVLSKHSIESDWVEWEAQKARELEKELRRQGDHRHVLCPVALDDSWEDATWPGHLKHQIKKYNVLDFSDWRDEEVLEGMFSRLLDGLGIYYRSDSE